MVKCRLCVWEAASLKCPLVYKFNVNTRLIISKIPSVNLQYVTFSCLFIHWKVSELHLQLPAIWNILDLIVKAMWYSVSKRPFPDIIKLSEAWGSEAGVSTSLSRTLLLFHRLFKPHRPCNLQMPFSSLTRSLTFKMILRCLDEIVWAVLRGKHTLSVVCRRRNSWEESDFSQLSHGGCVCAVKLVIHSGLPVIEGRGLRTESANTLQQEMVCFGKCFGGMEVPVPQCMKTVTVTVRLFVCEEGITTAFGSGHFFGGCRLLPVKGDCLHLPGARLSSTHTHKHTHTHTYRCRTTHTYVRQSFSVGSQR